MWPLACFQRIAFSEFGIILQMKESLVSYCGWKTLISLDLILLPPLCKKGMIFSKHLKMLIFCCLHSYNNDNMSRLITKPIKWHVRPAKTQISLGIRPVRSESSLSTWVLSLPLSTQRRLWSDWADAQADLSLRRALMSFCWFCHEAADMP